MFSLFKKTIHDPFEKQIEDLRREPIGPIAMAGDDCDAVTGGSGPFGLSYNNPIPVNGLIGTYKYLGKLLSRTGHVFYFHRLGSLTSDITKNPVDAYELVDLTGENWDILFLDLYHPRRSNAIPPGYMYKKYNKKLGDIPFAFGVDIYCPRFPYDLPEAIEKRNDWPAFARRVRERVSRGGFDRPKTHALKLAMVQMKV